MDTALRVMKVFSEARADGVDAPYVSFMLPFAANSDTRTQLISLYNNIYAKNLYSDVWFKLDGKPMLMAHGAALNRDDAKQKTIYDFFTFRANIPGYTDTETAHNQWGWLSRYPQAFFHNSDGEIEQITVGTAVNHDYVNRVIAPMSLGENVIGRTWTSRGYDNRENAILYGACLAEQWENALTVDPEIVFVTAWNEWVAMRIGNWADMYYNCFVDQYNAEFSRDCEPSAGVLKDHYYYQLADYIRQFKGTNPIEKASEEKLIDVNGGYGQWANVSPTYNDYFGLPDRDAYGYRNPETGSRYHYTNDSGRNDIYEAKVARDYDNLYFMVRTVDDLTPYTDAYWMRLYIDVGESEQNWENYEYILNKSNPDDATTATLERFTGNGFETEVVGKVTYAVKGNVLTVCIPKDMLGFGGQLDFEFGFKWTDNTLEDGDIMQWYLNGDVAPVGRFNYCYTTTGSDPYVEEAASNEHLMDMTDKDTQEMILNYLIDDKTAGMEYEFTEDGLKLTSTATGADSLFVMDYEACYPQVVLDHFDTLCITYKVVDGDVDTLRASVGISGRPCSARTSKSKDVVADGETHTVEWATKVFRATEGYAYNMAILFAEDAPAGQSIIIESIRFVQSEEAES